LGYFKRCLLTRASILPSLHFDCNRAEGRARGGILKTKMQRLLFIGLAGGAGTLLRYWLSEFTARRFGEQFPVGTVVVNLVGCFFAGVLFYVIFDRYALSPTLRTIILIGLLGGFTTFSSYGLQTFALLRDGQMGLALFNIALSNVGGLLLVWFGYSLAKIL